MIMTIVLFYASIVLAPWWLTTMVAVVLLARWNLAIPVIVGGMLMDLVYGAPLPLLGGYALLYTITLALLSLVSLYLHATMLE